MKTTGFVHKTVRLLGTAVLRRMPRTRVWARGAYWKIQRIKYDRFAKKIAIDNRLIFFESFGGRSCGDSPRAIYLAMLDDERFKDYRFVWSFKGHERTEEMKGDLLFDDPRVTIVQRGSKEYFHVLASAKYDIQNMRLPEYVYPKQDQVFIQCWHGTPLKRLGNDIKMKTSAALNSSDELADRYRMDGKKWSFLVSPSPYTSKHLADAFGLPEEKRSSAILEVGYPRNDELARAHIDATRSHEREVRKELGIPEGKNVLLYAPTWRDNSYKVGMGYTFDYLIDFDLLQRELGEDWVVLFRPHYFIANQFDFSAYEGFVIDVSAWGNINDLYIAADVLITDYSSVMFDYAILHRPIMLFVPDYDEYANDIRGFYFDLSEIPGPHVRKTEELVARLQDLDGYWSCYREAYDAYVQRFCPMDDGHAAERVIDRVWGSADE